MNINRKFLLLIGWILIFTVITLSLININSMVPDVKNGDKIGHFIAYFSLMIWFAWLYPKVWVRNLYAIGFIFMGGLMEILQSMTQYRSMDIDDFHVNTIGVIIGFVFAIITANIPIIKKTFRL
jgi:VanZ family protein